MEYSAHPQRMLERFHSLLLGPLVGWDRARADPGSCACAHPAIATLFVYMLTRSWLSQWMLSVKSGKHLPPNGATNRTEHVYGTGNTEALFAARRM